MPDPTQPVFTDPAMARFFAWLLPYYAGLWFLVSPFGYLTVLGVSWGANTLHRLRRG